MNTKIHLLCCENIQKEVEQAAKNEHLDDLTITSFPSYCNILQKSTIDSSLESIDDIEIKNLFLISCKTCPIFKTIKIPEERHITTDTVFALFLDQKLIQKKISQGGYLVTQGWLMHWKESINRLGFNQNDLQTFFKGFAKKIIYIDSSEEYNFEQIYEFSKYINLPYEHIPVNLDYLRLSLKHMSLRWEMTNEKTDLQDKRQELNKQVADYATMFTILNELSMFTTEREVIDKIREILKMLLGASNVTYFTPKIFQEKDPVLYEEILLSQFAFIDDGNGFVYSISFRNEVLGFFQLTGFLFNQYVRKYLNFCLQTVNILSVAISNIRNYKRIFDMSMHDSLTGLKNRDFYEKHLIKINQEKAYGTGILVCDIDNLKITNDTLGHKSGDHLILRVGEILKKSFRDTDFICRIGGDEFAVFVKDSTPESIGTMLTRLEHHLIENNALYKNDQENPSLSFSYGYAVYTEGDFDITTTFRIADERMYKNKHQKREMNLSKKSISTP